jgi:lysophospholipase L1-like esterase
VGSLAVAFLVAELGVRLLLGLGLLRSEAVFPPDIPYAVAFRRSANRTLGWELDPADPQVNSAGFRDRERQVDAGGAARIAVLGDSVTLGRGVPADRVFSALIEQQLTREARGGGPAPEVLNFGVGGYNTSQEAELYATRARRFHPDLLILAFVLNDSIDAQHALRALSRRKRAAQGPPPAPQPGARAPAPGAPLQAGILALPHSELVTLVRERLPQLFGSPQERRHPWLGFAFRRPENWAIVTGGLDRIAAMAQEDGTEVLVVIFPVLTDFESYEFAWVHAKVRAEAERHGFAVLDLLEVWRGKQAEGLRLQPDDTLHPNEEGHRAAAQAILEQLRSSGALARLERAPGLTRTSAPGGATARGAPGAAVRGAPVVDNPPSRH